MNKSLNNGTKGSKMIKVMATTAIAGMLLGGAVFEPTTMYAASKKQATTVTKANVQNQAQKVSMTQNGITLTATKSIFDGNHVQFEVKRSGGGLSSGITEGVWDNEQEEYILSKGAIKNIQIFIDGKSINDFGGLGQRPSLSWTKGADLDTAQITLVDPSWLGDQLYAFPNKFKLTAKITLEGTQQPFTLELPMQLTNKANTLQPKITKSYDGLSVTVNKVNANTSSTRLQLIEKGVEKNKSSNLMYEFVDDKGVVLDRISGFGTNSHNKAGDWYHNYVVEGVNKDVKSITIKPFKGELVNPEQTSGQFKVDENGNLIKHYIKELEMTVKLK
ncbi:DUF5643 domain-containing protein [Paenibacillus turicensis]|uniref:DUF5643 domain-containing protein n=1 Tax=Paenibacillus turicensis TaxID=160487 RepID=UPI003D2709B0